jgi:HEAT repeat protein
LCWVAAGLLPLAAGGCGIFGGRPPEDELAEAARRRRRVALAGSQLRSPDPAVRRQAAIELLTMQHPAAFEAATEAMLADERPEVRISVIRAAAFTRQDRCFARLLQALEDPSAEVRQEAAAGLSRFTDPEHVEAMADLVADRGVPPGRRQLLIEALGEAVAFQAVPVLLEALESEQKELSVAAWGALRDISRRRLPPDPERWRQWAEDNAYLRREDLLEEHLQAARHQLSESTRELNRLKSQQEELMELVRADNGEDPAALVRALDSSYVAVRRYAAARMASLPPQQMAAIGLQKQDYPLLQQALQDESVAVRRDVARFIARTDPPRRDALIRQALEDSDPQVLTIAIEAVRGDADRDTVGRLEKLLVESDAPAVREAAANALGKVGGAQSVPALLQALDDPEANVRWFAVEALRKLNADRATLQLGEMLKEDPNARVREIVATTLGELGQPASVPALRGALDDRSERVRQRAVAALQSLATGNFERMMVIARALTEHRFYSEAEGILTAILEDEEGPADEEQLAEACRQLAVARTRRGDHDGAVAAYLKLTELTGGSLEARRGLVHARLRAGEPQKAVDALERWLAQEEGQAALVELALETAQTLVESEQREQASRLVELLGRTVEEQGDERTLRKIESLREQLRE